MPRIELIYDPECPNVEEAREHLRCACEQLGLPAIWTEWDGSAAGAPAYVRDYGSPTILVDGQDVVPTNLPGASICCRIYPDQGTYRRAPSGEEIAAKLRQAGAGDAVETGGQRATWRSGLATLPGIAVALLPNLACPACWPAYASLMSSIGLGLVIDSRYLLGLTLVFLAGAIAGLAYRAANRRGYGPFWLGLVAAVMVVAGKFGLQSRPLLAAGIAILLAASLWNSWPRQPARTGRTACHSHEGG